VVVLALSAAAPVVSPIGWEYWPQVLKTVRMSQELQIEEYRAALSLQDGPFWIGVAALLALAVVRRRAIADLPSANRVLLLASLVLAVAGVMAGRNESMFAVIAAPTICTLWPTSRTRARRRRPAGALAYGLVGAAVVAACAVVATHWQRAGQGPEWQPLSRGAIAAVRRCPEPTFNRFEDGGYLMWVLPERRVFVDSRLEAYPLELLRLSREADLFGNHSEAFSRYGVNCAVVATGSPLERRLIDEGAMEPIYRDVRRAVFVRTDGRHGRLRSAVR
jgi:hypothetical protein